MEQRYWELCSEQVQLWRVDYCGDDGADKDHHTRRHVLGHSFGCRIAFAFAGRFDKAGVADVRVVLMDGRIANQPFFAPQAGDVAAHALKDSLRAKHGDLAVDNMTRLGQLPIECQRHNFDCSVRSGCVHVLYVASEEPMGLERTRELGTNVEVLQLEGMHVEALQRVAHGDACREFAEKVQEFIVR